MWHNCNQSHEMDTLNSTASIYKTDQNYQTHTSTYLMMQNHHNLHLDQKMNKII